MANIVFCIINAQSHYNATYKVAHALKKKGNNIVYFGSQNYHHQVTSSGFDFYPIPANHYPTTQEKKTGANQYRKNFLSGDFFDDMIADIKPSLVVLDLSMIYYSFFLIAKKIKFVIFSTKVCLDKAYNIPPCTSDLIPKDDFISPFKVSSVWLKLFALRTIKHYKAHLNSQTVSHFNLALEYAKSKNLKVSDYVDDKRALHFRLKNVPELILSSRDFDFPRPTHKNQQYVGPTADLSRKEFVDSKTLKEIEEIIVKKAQTNKKLIYCSLGMYDSKYKVKRTKIFSKVINLLMRRKDFILILSLGDGVKLNHDINSEEIYLYNKVPQLLILQNADLMITHGGMQSITECILNAVPMLVYPLNESSDQPGNSARVVYHKLGLRGSIIKDSIECIERKIDILLGNSSYKEKLENMKSSILQRNDFEKSIDFITQAAS